MAYKCTNCGGELAYDPSIGKLSCKFCGETYDVDEFENPHDHDHDHNHDHNHAGHVHNVSDQQDALSQGFDKATDDTTDVKEDLRLYQCSNCGAEVVTDKNTTATTCVFCNQPMVLQENMQGEFAPDYVIPFAVDKKQIEDLYENYIKDKPFYPEEYSKANVIEKIKAVYLPFWLYDMTTSGDVQATGEILRTRTTRDWIITDHDVFALDRAGAMEFNDVPVIASSKTPKNAMDAIEPFDYSRMVPFNKNYLPGFLAERWDKDAKTCSDAAKTRAQNTFESRLTSTLGPYSNVRIQNGNMNHAVKDGSYALMPSYILFMDYDQDEDKLVAINGQTGKVVGNVPVDPKKRNMFFISRFLILWVVLLIIGLLIFIML